MFANAKYNAGTNRCKDWAAANRDMLLKVIIGTCLATATYVVFFKVVRFDFISMDTAAYVYDNPHLKAGFTLDSVSWAFTSTEISNWHPVTWLSHMADVALFGLHAGAHHHTSLILHIVNTLLLFLFLDAATGRLWRAGLVALLFALHPLHVESVVWVAERKDLLCGFFFFCSLLAYWKYVSDRGFKWYVTTFCSFILGFMAKPMIVTLPFLLLVLDFWPLGRIAGGRPANPALAVQQPPVKSVLMEKVPMLLATIGMSVLVMNIQAHSGAMTTVSELPVNERFFNALLSYILYLRDTFWPFDLCVYYPLAPPIRKEIALLALTGIGLLSALAFSLRKKFGWALSGWLWYLGMLVPVIGIIQVGAQSRADRYMYLPSIGIYLILVWGLATLAERSKAVRIITVAVGVLALLIMALITSRQIDYWKNSETLYRQALAITEKNSVIHYNLGLTLYRQDRISEAKRHFTAAVEYAPGDSQSHYMLGLCLERLGQTEGAISYLLNACKLNNNFIDAYISLASIFRQTGRVEAAIMTYREALEKSPEAPRLHNNLATSLVTRGNLKEAKRHLERALAYDPGNQKAMQNRRLIEHIENEISETLQKNQNVLVGVLPGDDYPPEIIFTIKSIFIKYRVMISNRNVAELVSRKILIPNTERQ